MHLELLWPRFLSSNSQNETTGAKMLNICCTYLNIYFNVKLVNWKWKTSVQKKCGLFSYLVLIVIVPSLATELSPRWSAWTSWWRCWGRCRSVWRGLCSPSSPGSAAGTSSWLETAGSGLSCPHKGHRSLFNDTENEYLAVLHLCVRSGAAKCNNMLDNNEGFHLLRWTPTFQMWTV